MSFWSSSGIWTTPTYWLPLMQRVVCRWVPVVWMQHEKCLSKCYCSLPKTLADHFQVHVLSVCFLSVFVQEIHELGLVDIHCCIIMTSVSILICEVFCHHDHKLPNLSDETWFLSNCDVLAFAFISARQVLDSDSTRRGHCWLWQHQTMVSRSWPIGMATSCYVHLKHLVPLIPIEQHQSLLCLRWVLGYPQGFTSPFSSNLAIEFCSHI